MSLQFLLDANVLSEPTRKRPDPEVIARLVAVEGEAGTAAVIWHELHYGVGRLPPGRRRSGLSAYLRELASRFEVLPYDKRAARWHAQERARLEAEGLVRPFADGQVAATAVVNELVLVTRNAADFTGYRDLAVENWWGGRSFT